MTDSHFLSESECQALLPYRAKGAHKGDCGRVFVLAGSVSMIGAAVLAAKAALRSGAGLVYLLTVQEATQSVNVEVPEIIVLPLVSEDGILTMTAFSDVQRYFEQFKVSVVAIGPGLGRDDRTQDLVREVLRFVSERQISSVIDADALFALSVSSFSGWPMAQSVLTPHPKEFERLTGQVVLEENRLDLASELAQNIQQIVILKGRHSVIAHAGTGVLNPTGNEGMATAGSGDVLTGVIAALVAQGLMLYDAACLGAYCHGLAGDCAQKKLGTLSMIASDIIDALPEAFQILGET